MNALRYALPTILVIVIVLAAGHPAQAQDADAVFQRLLDKYETISSLRASFTQTMTTPYSDDEASFSGRLMLQGDQYRVETGTEVLIVNERETFVYRPQEQQLLINDTVNDENSFSPSEFLLDYHQRFDVAEASAETLNGERHYRLTLLPRNPDSFFLEATLWMRDRDALITRLEVLDANETRMIFELDDLELNPPLAPDTFRFTAPEGVEVIDLRS